MLQSSGSMENSNAANNSALAAARRNSALILVMPKGKKTKEKLWRDYCNKLWHTRDKC